MTCPDRATISSSHRAIRCSSVASNKCVLTSANFGVQIEMMCNIWKSPAQSVPQTSAYPSLFCSGMVGGGGEIYTHHVCMYYSVC